MAKLTIEQTAFVRATADRIEIVQRYITQGKFERAQQILTLAQSGCREFIETDGFQSKGKHRG